MARSARCDVRWRAAVFVESDETTGSEDLHQSHAFRRLLLQIGGANIAAARSELINSALGRQLIGRNHDGRGCPGKRRDRCGLTVRQYLLRQ